MLLENLIYTTSDNLNIKGNIDGNADETHFPAIAGNPHYDEMEDQTLTPAAYSPPAMTMDEFRGYRDQEMDIVDIKKASATQLDDMTAQEVTDTKTWKQDMRDRPADSATITAVAALDLGDKAGAVALFPTKPAIIA